MISSHLLIVPATKETLLIMCQLEEECNEAVTRCYVCKAILLNQSKGKRTDGRLMKCSVCGRTGGIDLFCVFVDAYGVAV